MLMNTLTMCSEHLHNQIRQIKAELRQGMNGAVSASMRQKGLDYKVNFGVELPRIKMIAAGYEKNHQLAQALWKEDIRECKILAGLLQPVETFLPEIADIWVEDIHNPEIAELTSMNLFQHLPYAPAKAFQWIASGHEYRQICGFHVIARLLMRRGDMNPRAENEFLDQAVAAFLSGSYHVQAAVAAALRRFMQHSGANALAAASRVSGMKGSPRAEEALLSQVVESELD